MTDFVVQRTPPLGRLGRAYAVIVSTPPDDQTVRAEAFLFFTHGTVRRGRQLRHYTTFAFPPLVVDEPFIRARALRWLEDELLEVMIASDDPTARPADATFSACDTHELYFLGLQQRGLGALSWIRQATRSRALREFVDRILESAPLQGDVIPPGNDP